MGQRGQCCIELEPSFESTCVALLLEESLSWTTNKIPSNCVWTSFVSAMEEKKNLNEAQNKAWKKTLSKRRQREEESEKRWWTEGLFLATLQNIFRTMLKITGTAKNAGIQVYLSPPCSSISSDNIHITHKITKILFGKDGSQHGLQLFVALWASTVVS